MKTPAKTSRSYASWIVDLKNRWRATQIKAAVAVNSALIEFYWDLGRDISERYPGEVYGGKFFETLGTDLRQAIPGANGFTKVNLTYCLKFYRLYAERPIVPQLVERSRRNRQQFVDDTILQQLVAELALVPWGHHRTIIDKCKGDRDKAIFYVRRTIQNGWSRSVLLNWLSTGLYEREKHAQTNFALTMPAADSDLARQLVQDPQVFEVFGLRERYDETQLKAAIATNIERTLLSLGRGVSFLGREYPVEIGGETKYIDLLFYVVPLHRYLVMEVKTTKYEPADLGQLSGYMAIAESVLNTPGDNPPIGVLVCREHNRVLAKIHLEKLGLPMGITDYQVKRLLPSPAQLAKCFADAEAQLATNSGKNCGESH
jgi:predicted nuclease of restriction endonuclease-like (RecB) superfamily